MGSACLYPTLPPPSSPILQQILHFMLYLRFPICVFLNAPLIVRRCTNEYCVHCMTYYTLFLSFCGFTPTNIDGDMDCYHSRTTRPKQKKWNCVIRKTDYMSENKPHRVCQNLYILNSPEDIECGYRNHTICSSSSTLRAYRLNWTHSTTTTITLHFHSPVYSRSFRVSQAFCVLQTIGSNSYLYTGSKCLNVMFRQGVYRRFVRTFYALWFMIPCGLFDFTYFLLCFLYFPDSPITS